MTKQPVTPETEFLRQVCASAGCIDLWYNYSWLSINTIYKEYGLSVRCMKGERIILLPDLIRLDKADVIRGEEITLYGRNFGSDIDAGNVIFTDMYAKNITLWSDTLIKVIVPASAKTGLISVTVNEKRSASLEYIVDTTLIKIGAQTWMARNLDAAFYRDGTPIRHCKTAAEWRDAASREEGAWRYYDNSPYYGEIYGKLYNWFAVVDPRGIAPEGWHVPASGEGFGGGGSLKGGWCNVTGEFYDIGKYGIYWTTSTHYTYVISSKDNHALPGYGYSVRCIKD